MSKSVKSVDSVLESVGCMYIQVDDPQQHCQWYEKLFNAAGTRKVGIFWDKSLEKENVNNNFKTDEWIRGEIYEMFSLSFETDCIEELYDRLKAANVELEPLEANDQRMAFVYKDPQGHKFQVWQSLMTEPQPLRDDVPALMRISALYFPVSDPAETYRWYTEVLGAAISENGQPMTSDGVEFYFIKSIVPGRTFNLPNDHGGLPAHAHDINTPERSCVNIPVNGGLEELHKRMVKEKQVVQNPIFNRDG